MPENDDGCVSTARGPIGGNAKAAPARQEEREVTAVTARVGAAAPDFEASALVAGRFKNLRLSDYLGHWVVLCFYPGDFTFV